MLVLALAGCGSSGGDAKDGTSASSAATSEKTPSAQELIDQMKASAAAATSGRFAGSMVVEGKPGTIDLKGARDGSNQSMSMSVSGEGSATVLTVDGKDYVKGDEAFWKQNGPEGLFEAVGDKFVVAPEPMSKEFNLGKVLDDIVGTDVTSLDLVNTKVEKTDLDGAAAYLLTQRVGTDDTKLWLSADGKANMLKITGTDNDGPMSLTFSEWNTVPAFTAPPADQVAES